ncbi:MAG TPA: secretin N-terminal domain-containing protein [Longimicrobiales bacterium]|nr:secretin N-terminal domain-containing protein [Longimicrobiales bacterium]
MSARTHSRTAPRLALIAALVLLALALCAGMAPVALAGQDPDAFTTDRSGIGRISVTWTEAPIREVLQAFAAFSGRSIVVGEAVDGFVTADINDQPWDVALRAILSVHGLVAIEDEYGIIRVDAVSAIGAREELEPLLTRSYPVSYSRAAELQPVIASLLSPRGSVAVVESTNTLVVSDIERVHAAIRGLLP